MKKNPLFPSSALNKFILVTGLFAGLFLQLSAQDRDSVYCSAATGAAQQKLYQNISRNIIQKKLKDSLSHSSSEAWADAFEAILLINQKSAWIDQKIGEAVSKSDQMPIPFQKKLLELLQGQRRYGYRDAMERKWGSMTDSSLVAMTAWYLYCSDSSRQSFITSAFRQHPLYDGSKPVMKIVDEHMHAEKDIAKLQPIITAIVSPGYLRGQTLLFCLLPQNRDQPGLLFIRDSSGAWLTDEGRQFSHIKVLARSLSNMPGIFRLGNTPQGLYRMDGYGKSLSNMIGPSDNVQLTMPYEYQAGHFYMDNTLANNDWGMERYKNLLPAPANGYGPLYESFYAGQDGRTEIIIHGHTTDPLWYRDAEYWPMIPSNGCLTTQESWNAANGRRLHSSQQALINLINRAGGPKGYLIVMEIPFKGKALQLTDIMEYFKAANGR